MTARDQIRTALADAAAQMGAVNPTVVASILLDAEGVTVDEEAMTVTGVGDAMFSLRDSHPDLFDTNRDQTATERTINRIESNRPPAEGEWTVAHLERSGVWRGKAKHAAGRGDRSAAEALRQYAELHPAEPAQRPASGSVAHGRALYEAKRHRGARTTQEES